MKEKRAFGELELAILQIFKSEQRLTVRDVLDGLRSHDKYTTVMTVMNRMVEKKLLKRERVGQQYEYWVSGLDKIKQPRLFDKLKQTIFGGRASSMVSYLIESSNDITDEELNEMEKLIKHVKKSRKQS